MGVHYVRCRPGCDDVGEPIPLDIYAAAGVALWLTGFAIEVIADRQKSAFRADPDNRNKFIQSGLWAWSRHPNYFGEIVLWSGIALIAFPVLEGWQYATLISPVFVVVLLTKISGVRMLENRANKQWGNDPDYQAYRDRTSVLVPMPAGLIKGLPSTMTTTWFHDDGVNAITLPASFEDIRMSDALVARYIERYTSPGDLILDPFAGYGTTLTVMPSRWAVLVWGLNSILGARGVRRDGLSWASLRPMYRRPNCRRKVWRSAFRHPYMNRDDPEDPLTAYRLPLSAYADFIEALANLYVRLGTSLADDGTLAIQLQNLRRAGVHTPLVYDLQHAIGDGLDFVGDDLVLWDTPSYGYSHGVTLVYRREPLERHRSETGPDLFDGRRLLERGEVAALVPHVEVAKVGEALGCPSLGGLENLFGKIVQPAGTLTGDNLLVRPMLSQ